jgi:amino acid transporter
MDEAARVPLAAWESFYVIVGSSGAALTGLQFVVIALGADSRKKRSTRETVDAFGTPTIVHFCAVLLIAAILSAPWQTLSRVSIGLAICGLVGMIYGFIVLRRARSQTAYKPVWEDWLWHAVLPLIAYVLLFLSAIFVRSYPHRTLFVIGGVALLLLFVGIHNAWDAVTYLAVDQAKPTVTEESSEDNNHQT